MISKLKLKHQADSSLIRNTLHVLHAFSFSQSFAAFVASKRKDCCETGSTSWGCCGQTFNEHSAVHKHVAKAHNADVQQLTQAAAEHLLKQLEGETERQQLNGQKEEDKDVSAWIPDISHVPEEQLKT